MLTYLLNNNLFYTNYQDYGIIVPHINKIFIIKNKK